MKELFCTAKLLENARPEPNVLWFLMATASREVVRDLRKAELPYAEQIATPAVDSGSTNEQNSWERSSAEQEETVISEEASSNGCLR